MRLHESLQETVCNEIEYVPYCWKLSAMRLHYEDIFYEKKTFLRSMKVICTGKNVLQCLLISAHAVQVDILHSEKKYRHNRNNITCNVESLSLVTIMYSFKLKAPWRPLNLTILYTLLMYQKVFYQINPGIANISRSCKILFVTRGA